MRPSPLISFKWSTSHHTLNDNLTEKQHLSTKQSNNMLKYFIACSFYCFILRSKQYTLANKYSAIRIGRDKRLSGILPKLVFLYRGQYLQCCQNKTGTIEDRKPSGQAAAKYTSKYLIQSLKKKSYNHNLIKSLLLIFLSEKYYSTSKTALKV